MLVPYESENLINFEQKAEEPLNTNFIIIVGMSSFDE